MQIITKEQAKRLVEDYQGSKFFTVSFIKRTTGELRTMNCRKGVTKHLSGGGAKYVFKDNGLVSVYDVKSEGYRTISLEGIKSIKMDNVEYVVQ